MSPWAWVAVIAIGCGGAGQQVTPVATSQPVASSQPGEPTTAKEAFELGQELFIGRRFAEAARAFHRGYELGGGPSFLHNEAISWEKSGDGARAVLACDAYVDASPNVRNRETLKQRCRATVQRSTVEE